MYRPMCQQLAMAEVTPCESVPGFCGTFSGFVAWEGSSGAIHDFCFLYGRLRVERTIYLSVRALQGIRGYRLRGFNLERVGVILDSACLLLLPILVLPQSSYIGSTLSDRESPL